MDSYPIAGYLVSHVLEPFKKSNFEGAVPSVYAATVCDGSGQYICGPGIVEKGSELSQSKVLEDNLMALTWDLVRQKAPTAAIPA